MRKLMLYFTILSIVALIIPGLAVSKPDNIKVIPRNGDRIDLFWQGQPGEEYDIWQSSDGSVWQKIYTTGAFAEGFSVTSGIEPFTNYYFLIASRDSISDPATDAAEGNATFVGPAYPPYQVPHYFYTSDTNLCSDCHTTHNGLGDGLLRYEEVDALCVTCHDGSQSKYNVLDGTVSRDGTWNDPLESAAGPFGELGGHTSGVVAESLHTPGMPLAAAPGGNPAAAGRDLSCVSCHSAHNTHNYRIIATQTPENEDVRVAAYAVTDKLGGRERVTYLAGMDNLCAGCHPDYLAGQGAGSQSAGGTYATEGKYRHPVGVAPAGITTLPLEGDQTGLIFCLTCHYAHGSSRAIALSDTNDTDGQTSAVNYLLRQDYSSACQDCHQK